MCVYQYQSESPVEIKELPVGELSREVALKKDEAKGEFWSELDKFQILNCATKISNHLQYFAVLFDARTGRDLVLTALSDFLNFSLSPVFDRKWEKVCKLLEAYTKKVGLLFP